MKTKWGIRLLANLFCLLSAGHAYSQDTISPQLKKDIVFEVCALIRENYVFPDTAARICETLQRSLEDGRYGKATDIQALVETLNADFQEVTGDRHLRARSTQSPPKKEPAIRDLVSPFFTYIPRNRRSNYGMPKVEILEGNVGYIEFISFKPLPDPGTERIVRGAMDFLSNCDALIVDLRRNGGGHPNMTEFVSSYFFDEPAQLSSRFMRETNSLKESWTMKDFYSRNLVDVPVYILTSKDTVSAPEVFSYDLQALKRAIIVGETTAGAVNSGRFFTVQNSIQLLIATGYSINPITKTHCEGTGVQPDVPVPSQDALATALELAKKAAAGHRETRAKSVDGHLQEFLSQLEDIEKMAVTDTVRAEGMASELIRHFYEIELMTPYLLLDLGNGYLKKGQENLAIFFLKQGPLYYSGLKEMYAFYNYLAEAYQRNGDHPNAIKCYLEYLKLFPYDDKALKKLNDVIERGKSLT